MSTASAGAGGSPDPHLRVGDAERSAAMTALDEHLSAGRLEADEYGDRVAKASVARTRDDLEVLFADLPPPNPWSPGQSRISQSAPVPASPRSPAPADGSQRAFGRRAGSVIVALSPIIALALFFATKWWIWFLLVPAIAAIVYGGRDEGRRGR
jgi:Domain of unknown function (DUF1707)